VQQNDMSSEKPDISDGGKFMQVVSIELPDTAFAALRKAPEDFVKEMRIAAAVKWYELGILSQGKAAEVAGLTRAEFIATLSRFKVSVWQYTAEELEAELSGEDLCA
jgi:predicted HTH domain antitoxin